MYIKPLIEDHRANGIGSHRKDMFVGVCAYANDVALLALSGQATQATFGTCERVAKESNILFSTHEEPSKRKCNALYTT